MNQWQSTRLREMGAQPKKWENVRSIAFKTSEGGQFRFDRSFIKLMRELDKGATLALFDAKI